MKYTTTALLALSILAGCDASAEKSPAQQAAKSAEAHNCTTTGPNSPIVTGENSVVVINGKTYAPGQNADCVPGATKISTHGAGSPIVTGAGARVTSTVER
ncbi:TPA: hypothetical protein ACXI4C_004252 [Pseudomonas aeruginosa]|uniref:hypothetical protein n=1 Tax=Pseudomonas aeruginosa group TaxID=136841 RepID=UPI001886037E|nr:hypothetical protein [Pseudomonas aeruginosa]ELD5773022.1 hypothetical protein [Pseudomonas aeruginosa]MBH4465061.1 hypothetical protein [Pseudomonas aeruginosa]MBX5850337.1 hypothetical protein [Pseudomonas aeruginosa]BDF97400.1 hypothetical protein [Pseudomonas aeruginosa]HBN9635164.1 hypothetical protein [Pseudomonas aeruginosa]